LQKLGLPADQIIIFVLGLLAINALVERLTYLRKLETNISSLSAKLGKPLFRTRPTLDAEEPFDQSLERARDLLIAGLSLVATVGPRRDILKRMMQQGSNLRFLLLDPSSPCLEIAARTHGVSADSLRSDITSTLHHLRQMGNLKSLANHKAGSLQVKLANTILGASIVMNDSTTKAGEITCELHLFHVGATERPAFRLTPTDGPVYSRFRDSIEALWTASELWAPQQPK